MRPTDAAEPSPAPDAHRHGWTPRQRRALAVVVLMGAAWIGWQVWRNPATIADPQPDWPEHFAEVRDRLDPNLESAERLAVLPGIGPAKAAAIAQHREVHGRFIDADNLAEVYGIGDATIRKLLPYLSFAGDNPSDGPGATPSTPSTRPAGG